MKVGILAIQGDFSLHKESLDKLDTHYQSISKVLDIPLFYDSPQIKQVVRDINGCREAILYVANQLVLNNREYIDGEEESNKTSQEG